MRTSTPKPGRASTHQPGQDAFRSILPEDIDWKPFPAFPASARLAVVVGQPEKPGPYTIRVRVPSGVKIMPHRHPENRVYTVISGVFYIGPGDQFDVDKANAYPPGSVVVLPGDTPHFHWAKSGELMEGPCADSVEKHEPASDDAIVVVDSLKALDPTRPIREADSCTAANHVIVFGA